MKRIPTLACGTLALLALALTQTPAAAGGNWSIGFQFGSPGYYRPWGPYYYHPYYYYRPVYVAPTPVGGPSSGSPGTGAAGSFPKVIVSFGSCQSSWSAFAASCMARVFGVFE